MDGLCNTSQTLCTRCQVNPRLPKQRWCRECLTTAQRLRRAAQHVAQSEDSSTPVTHAETQAMPGVTQEPRQPAVAPDAAHVLQQYRALAAECERLRTQDWSRSPYSPGVVYDPLVRQLDALRQRCQELGLPPALLKE
jgi:hypothetical protein